MPPRMQVTAAQMQKQYEEIRRELDVLNKQRGDDQRRIEKLKQAMPPWQSR